MNEPLKPKDIVEAAGISPSYASMILSGERIPPVPLAITIYRKTGHKFGLLIDASDADIEVLARLHGEARQAIEWPLGEKPAEAA